MMFFFFKFKQENELNKIKSDNMRIYSDYKLIKKDNTEIMHSLHNLSKTIDYFYIK